MTADRSAPVRSVLPDHAPSERTSPAAGGFADLLGGAHAASSRPAAYAASSRAAREPQGEPTAAEAALATPSLREELVHVPDAAPAAQPTGPAATTPATPEPATPG